MTIDLGGEMTEVRIGKALVGDNHPCFVVAEIGINHNGEIKNKKKLRSSDEN